MQRKSFLIAALTASVQAAHLRADLSATQMDPITAWPVPILDSAQTTGDCVNPISLENSIVTGLTGAQVDVPHTITVTAFGQDGVARTTGGEIFKLQILPECTISEFD